MNWDLLFGLPTRNRFDFALSRRGCFENAGGAGGGGGGAAGSGEGAGGGGGTGGTGGDGGAKPITFDDEGQFMRRLDRHWESKNEEMAKSLGFESFKAMQEAAKAKTEADKAAMTEAERLKTEKEEADRKAKDAEDRANKVLIDTKIEIAATQAGFVKPDQVVILLDRSGIKLENGQVTGIKEAVEAFAKDNPYMIGETKPPGSPGSTGNGGRQGGGSNEKGSFGKELAEKRAQANKNSSQAQGNYFS